MKTCDLKSFQKRLFEIEKGCDASDLTGSMFVLRFDFIQTEKTPNKAEEDAEFSEMPSTLDLMCSIDDSPSLPSALQDNNLETVYVANDGSYKHENGMVYMNDRYMKIIASTNMG